MEQDVVWARQSLRAVEEAQQAANRHSQNNGVLLLVWGVAVLVGMIGFDVLPWAIRRGSAGTYGALWPMLAPALLLLVVVGGASAWTQRYLRRLPVEAGVPSNPWMFVPTRRAHGRCTAKGWWSVYHMAVLLGGMAAGIVLAHALHSRCLLPGTMTLIGIIDAAPLLVTGGRLWRRAQRKAGPA